mmetsp:Transcript_29114/g.113084  ORF Transcript_29114/g.113084 Transcript_29114/m.113084 type:complete len:88 (-) Transcript_29114:1163-1426(-)
MKGCVLLFMEMLWNILVYVRHHACYRWFSFPFCGFKRVLQFSKVEREINSSKAFCCTSMLESVRSQRADDPHFEAHLDPYIVWNRRS